MECYFWVCKCEDLTQALPFAIPLVSQITAALLGILHITLIAL